MWSTALEIYRHVYALKRLATLPMRYDNIIFLFWKKNMLAGKLQIINLTLLFLHCLVTIAN